MSLYRDEAVVLRTWKLGEADRIISLHTRDHGKVRGVAKGVRRTRSKFGARLEPTSHIMVQLYEGRSDLHTITQAETIHRFESLRTDADRFARAESMLESVDHVAQDHVPDPELHTMLWRGLAALDRHDTPLLVPAFFLKLLAHEGVQPQLDSCIECGTHEDLVTIDVLGGGVRCGSCRRDRPLSAEALSILRRIYDGDLGRVLADPPSAADNEIDVLATALLESHLERRLRSTTVISQSGLR